MPAAVAVVEKKTTRKPPAWWRIWWTAARPHTLTASVSPCIVAWAATRPPWHLLATWTAFCVAVQLGTNLHNDYADFVLGADTEKRVGQARATARGWLTPGETCAAATGCLTIALLCGAHLILETGQRRNALAWFLVLSSIFNAFAYTGGPYPLGYVGLSGWSIGYSGLGELFVLLYFGFVAVLMLPYLLGCRDDDSGTSSTLVSTAGRPPEHAPVSWTRQCALGAEVGLLCTKIIVVNNLRDRHTDADAGKRTTAVRFGRTFCLAEYVLCDVVAYGLSVADAMMLLVPSSSPTAAATTTGGRWWPRWLPLLSLPLSVMETRAVFAKEGAALNKHVGGAAMVEFLFCILLALGMSFS